MNLRLLGIIGGSTLFTAAILVVVAWAVIGGEKAATERSEQFAAALVGGPAPKGADHYVRGVRSRYGTVSSARVIDTRNHRVGRGNNSRTYHLSDVLLQTAKGPVVVELKFDGFGPVSKDISDVYELAPRDVPDDKLSDAEFVALAKAYDQRGGNPASDLGITRVRVPDVVAKVRAAVTPSAQLRAAKRQLRCIQKAAGDVDKMAACSN